MARRRILNGIKSFVKTSLWIWGLLRFLGLWGLSTFSSYGMNFAFAPLGKSSQVEVGLSTAFAGGEIRGAFPRVGGQIEFKPEYLASTKGKVQLDARALQFGNYKVAGDAHSKEWLGSDQFPEISFTLNGLKQARWRGKELLATAHGSLKMKNRVSPFSMPVSIRYYRDQRRKVDGVKGDLLVLSGESSISRSQLGINPVTMIDAVMDKIRIKINLVGGSKRVRPFLPSTLFH